MGGEKALSCGRLRPLSELKFFRRCVVKDSNLAEPKKKDEKAPGKKAKSKQRQMAQREELKSASAAFGTRVERLMACPAGVELLILF